MHKRCWLITLALVGLVAASLACSVGDLPTLPPFLPQTGTPSPATVTPMKPTNTPLPGDTAQLVLVYFYTNSASSNQGLTIGSTAQFVISAEPSIRTIYRDGTGKVSVGTTRWENHPVVEMQYCLGVGKPCSLTGKWLPFDQRTATRITADWLGTQPVWLVMQFRDAAKQLVSAIFTGSNEPVVQTVQGSQNLSTYYDSRTPIASIPPAAQTAVAMTHTAYPVTGSVLWQDGNSAAGGTAGTTIDLKASFQASSPAGEVKEMRALPGGYCFGPVEVDKQPWMPFEAVKYYPFNLPINWVGYYISVQYRDIKGNLSLVYCDDISLEGSPPRPTP